MRDLHIDENSVFTFKDHIEIQKKLIKRQLSLIDYFPGSKLGKAAVKRLSKGAVRASGLLLKQGYRRAFSRSRT